MEKQVDPRVLRTRKLIMDAFIELAMKKAFKDITVKDITATATINRATFYFHFADKYDLLEKVLSENLMKEVLQEVNTHESLNEESLQEIFLSIIKFQVALQNQCKRSYEAFVPQIEAIFKLELQKSFSVLVQKQSPDHNELEAEAFAVMLSWALYGGAVHWMQTQAIPPEDYAKRVMYLVNKRASTDKGELTPG